jgi:hypothetical protein
LEELFTSGRIVDLILVFVAIETAGLALLARHHAKLGSKFGPVSALLPNLASGACLLLALRVALGGGWWGWIALCLAGSLVAHLLDLASRLR